MAPLTGEAIWIDWCQLVASAAVSVVIALVLSSSLEWMRRPRLLISAQPTRPGKYFIAHVSVRNASLSERGPVRKRIWAHAFTAHPANGGEVELTITGAAVGPLRFHGKWSTTRQPLTDDDRFSVHLLPGIHHVTLQPGSSDSVAVAHHLEGQSAYAFKTEAIYRDQTLRHPGCELPPGRYAVEAQAKAGEIVSRRARFELIVGDAPRDLELREDPRPRRSGRFPRRGS